MKPKLVAIALFAAAALAPAVAHPNDALMRAAEASESYRWAEALAWYEVAAQAGDRNAQKVAGLMYLYGDRLYPGVRRDLDRAKAWLRRAEAQGSIDARYVLARLERDPTLDPARLAASMRDETQQR